jgi:lysophospholipase L1-like esterase
MAKRFTRFVAMGDSTVEGLDDPDGEGGYRGWADRLAARIAREQGSLLYANLGVRGRTTRQIREEQLAPALAMRPDLVTLVSGTNDLLRPKFDSAGVAGDVEVMQRALIEIGATVVTFTLPDLREVMPFARLMGVRTEALNEALREVSARTGAIVLDLAREPVASDPRLWSGDRLHANSIGHARIADGFAYALGLHTDRSWADPFPPARPATLREKIAAEGAWVGQWLMPWMWRHLRGTSSGDGRVAKRPVMMEVTQDR